MMKDKIDCYNAFLSFYSISAYTVSVSKRTLDKGRSAGTTGAKGAILENRLIHIKILWVRDKYFDLA